jgi:hypothetical protein
MFKASVSDNRPIRDPGLAVSPESRSDGNPEMRMALCGLMLLSRSTALFGSAGNVVGF